VQCACSSEQSAKQVAFNPQTNPYMLYELLTDVVIRSTLFWDIISCTQLKANRRFGGTFCLHLEGWSLKCVSNRQEISAKCGRSWQGYRHLALRPWRIQYVVPKSRLTSSRLHCATSHNTVVFLFITLRTSDLNRFNCSVWSCNSDCLHAT
jgi:hypothetical protein